MHLRLVLALLLSLCVLRAEDEFPLTEDSKPHDGIPKGELIKGSYTAKDGSLFPGTEREYAIYLPANLDKTKPEPFMVFQDGVIYNAPTVFDNLIAKKDIPAMIGIFIKPGVVPAANDNALPRYNRSYEYDSVTDNYARFLIDEFLPAIKAKHGLNLSDDPNARGIAGNSSGGICAFMVAWHRPDQFRRVFTGVGTYVGIHGADQLPVLVRKFEPKPLRVFLQSGENDNNLYCGDWWLANQMMERSLTWNGYEVNHAWGTSGHNAKHASQIFPDVLRWLWKGYPNEPVKANPRWDAKWVGGQVVGDGEWLAIKESRALRVTGDTTGTVLAYGGVESRLRAVEGVFKNDPNIWGAYTTVLSFGINELFVYGLQAFPPEPGSGFHMQRGKTQIEPTDGNGYFRYVATSEHMIGTHGERIIVAKDNCISVFTIERDMHLVSSLYLDDHGLQGPSGRHSATKLRSLCLSPDQSTLYASTGQDRIVVLHHSSEGKLSQAQLFGQLELPWNGDISAAGMCVDTNGWLYVATSLGIQVLDQAGRVNFIIPTPKPPHDVCFGGKDLSDLFIACGDTIYKRPTKAHGYISGQMAPIKPPAPKL